jgi:HEAT repeat protein
MGMITDKLADEWENNLPKSAWIYRLIEKAEDSTSLKNRIWAIGALGNSRDPRAVRSLIVCCEDQNPDIRRCAIEGLKCIRSGRSVEALITRLRDKEEQPEIRLSAAGALASIRSFGAMIELRNRYADPDEEEIIRSFIGGELERVNPW